MTEDVTKMVVLFVDKYGREDGLQVNDLNELQHSVSVYQTLDGFDLVQLKAVDLVVLQVNQLDASDYEMLRLLMTETPDMPVVAITAANDPDEHAHAIELGVVDYFTLPLNRTILAARLNAIARKREKVEEQQAHVKRLESLEHDLRTVILPLGIALSAEKNFEQLLERMVIEAKHLCNADAGTLYLSETQRTLTFAIMRTDSLGIALGGTTGKRISFEPLRLYDEAGQPNYLNVATSAALKGESINIPDIYNAGEFDFSSTKAFDQKNQYRSISSLTIPLKDNENDVIGVLQLLNAKDPETGEVIAFDAYQQLVVESLASQAAIALSNQLLMERQKNLFKLESELQTAQQIQSGFLPDALPNVPGWEIASCFRPARAVAGDFYDVFSLQNNRIGFIIADVCDKGVPAALFMALIRSLIRAFSLQQDLLMGSDPVGVIAPTTTAIGQTVRTKLLKSIVALTNDYIIENHSHLNMFATMFYGILDTQTGTLSYVNAGHNPPVIIQANGNKILLKPTDPAVGMMPHIKYRINYAILDPGDTLVTFTDGILDARNPSGDSYGDIRLQALFDEPVTSASRLMHYIEENTLAHVGTGDQFDDITMLIVRHMPTA